MNIKIEPTEKQFSSCAGLLSAKEVMQGFRLKDSLSKVMPSNSARSVRKFENLIFGLIVGADCLDDMENLHADSGFSTLCENRDYTPKSYGDLLRQFTKYHCKLGNYELADLSYAMRSRVVPKQESITIDIDSTVIRQHGKKMEGVRKNPHGYLCLDTITACDELGFQYWHDVRRGNTHTSIGSKEMIHEIFNRMPKTSEYRKVRKYVRADSGYCQFDFFNACFAKDARFVVRMRADMLERLIPRIDNWQSQNPNKKDRILFYDGRECEIGRTYYTPKRCEGILRAVVIRALKDKVRPGLIEHHDNYDYFAWVSSIGEHDMKNDELIRFYRKRGNVENCIREMKNGFDLKHYPCLKLVANKAYGLAASFAYNVMRYLALLLDSKNPSYAKALRLRVIHRPAQIVRHARKVVFRFTTNHFEEVKSWLEKIKNIQLGIATSESGRLSDAL